MPNEKLKIPDDLKAMYTMQKQVAHSFRDDDDVVKVAHRTQMLIERIARLEAENDTLALKNAALEAQLLSQPNSVRTAMTITRPASCR
jgi:hypothetical protein